jgi:hypothetical protein
LILEETAPGGAVFLWFFYDWQVSGVPVTCQNWD